MLAGSVLATLRNATDPSVQALRDLATFRTFLSGPGIFPVMDAPWTPIFLGVIFMLHPLLGWLSLAGASVLFALALTNELATRNLLAASSVASFKALNRAEAAVRNADVIEAMGMMPQLVRRWHRQNAESLDLQARASSRSTSITSASKFLRLVLQIGILGVGAWLVIESELTPGAMIAASILMGRALAHPGLPSQVRFTALNQRNLAPANGTVTAVSADRLVDDRTGESYYLTRVELADGFAEALGGVPLYPGMQAEVMIVTGERSALDYLIRPFARSLNRAFRKD